MACKVEIYGVQLTSAPKRFASQQNKLMIQPSERAAFLYQFFERIYNMKYNIPKHELTLTVDGSSVKVIFERELPQTGIWHYVFTALAKQGPHSVPSLPLK